MCLTRHFVYIFFNPVFQLSTAKNEINLFNNHILIVAPVTFAPAGATKPSTEFLLFHTNYNNVSWIQRWLMNFQVVFLEETPLPPCKKKTTTKKHTHTQNN